MHFVPRELKMTHSIQCSFCFLQHANPAPDFYYYISASTNWVPQMTQHLRTGWSIGHALTARNQPPFLVLLRGLYCREQAKCWARLNCLWGGTYAQEGPKLAVAAFCTNLRQYVLRAEVGK